MSTYTEQGRSNAFLLKDVDAFVADAERFGIEFHDHALKLAQDDASGAVTLYAYDGWPSLDDGSVVMALGLDLEEDYDAADEEELKNMLPDGGEDDPRHPSDFAGLVARHLAEGQTAVFRAIGSEKMRYLGGAAIAVNASGDRVHVSLDDIDELAKSLGNPVSPSDD